jgi:hypothetical protein
MNKLHLAAIVVMVCSVPPVYGAPNPTPSVQLNRTVSLSETLQIQKNFQAGSATASGVVVEKFTGQVQTSQVRTAPAWPSP